MKNTIIVGAGIGGLTTALELAKAGQNVTVLEAHVEPGGCAATFFHKGYRFDAGATLAAGFAPGAPLDFLSQRFEIDWQSRPTLAAMQVHLPDGSVVTRWIEPKRWQEERRSIFGESAEDFWQWQESTADTLWQLANQFPPWPPQTIVDIFSLGDIAVHWLKNQSVKDYAKITRSVFVSAEKYIPRNSERLRQYIDAQLLISAQATSQNTNALYSAVALDLARQGVAQIPGGMGRIANKLAEALRRHGGQILYRQTVTRVRPKHGQQFEIETQRGDSHLADKVIFNLPLRNIKMLLGEAAPKRLSLLRDQPTVGWGAFMLYVGITENIIPQNFPLHQQIIVREPLSEGNSVFLSLSPSWDRSRSPAGYRAVTISTHTRLAPWWRLRNKDSEAYETRKSIYTARILEACEKILPGFSASTDLVLSGTPVTFEKFTRRALGWVGGFPQTNLFRTRGPRLAPGLWMVGDSIFPGQSVPAVTLGGIRVAQAVLAAQQHSAKRYQIPNKKLRRIEDLR